jgi:hypothetical protein
VSFAPRLGRLTLRRPLALSDIKVAVQHPSSFPVTERESIASLK